MRRAQQRLLFAACLAFPFSLVAQTPTYIPGDPNWKQVCAQSAATPLPAEIESPKTTTAPGCNAKAFYYGFHSAPDYPAALACAASRRKTDTSGDLDTTGILAELYANGNGVARNLPLALRFSCELAETAAQAETASRVERLQEMQSGKLPSSTHFDLCDDATSGMMGGWCADKDEQIADFARAQRIAALRHTMSAKAQSLLPALQAAETRFEDARIHGEAQGGGGSGSAGFALADQNLLREQFVRNLESFAAGKAPQATAAQKNGARRQLEAAMRDALSRPDSPGEFTREGIMATQKAWQQLFNTWMQFVPVAFPHVSQDDAATELLRLRTHQLKHL